MAEVLERRDYRHRKERVGYVIKDKMMKTRVVEVIRTLAHPLYGKVLRKRTRYKAHDEQNRTHVGDKVRIAETRPLSKDKRWRIVEVLNE
jgi:small subunit ribosomal protein S17